MYYLKFVCIVFISIAHVYTYGQSESEVNNVIFGESQKVSNKSDLLSIIGKKNGISIISRIKLSQPRTSNKYLEKYNSNFELIQSSPIVLKNEKYYKDCFLINDKIYLITYSSEKQGSDIKETYFVQTINFEDMSLNDDSKVLCVSKSKKNEVSIQMLFKFSEGTNKILAYHEGTGNKLKNHSYEYFVFENDFTPIYSNRLLLSSKKLSEVLSIFIDNSGNVSALERIHKESVKFIRKGEPNHRYVLTSCTDKGESVNKSTIKLKNKSLIDLHVTADSNGDILCGGVYSNSKSYYVDGAFWMKIDKTSKEITSVSLQEFENDFIHQTLKSKAGDNTSREKLIQKGKFFQKYLFKNIVRHDNGYSLIGEQYVLQPTTGGSARGMLDEFIQSFDFYNGIFILRISDLNEIQWAQIIPKKQKIGQYGKEEAASFHYSVSNRKIHFVYNDRKDNLADNEDGILYLNESKINAQVILATIDPVGSVKKQALFIDEKPELFIREANSAQLDLEETIFFWQADKEEGMIKVTFN